MINYKSVLATGFLICSFLLPSKVNASNFTGIYSLGDSLSDTGNVFGQIGFPPSPPYFNGHFSNGPIWLEDLSQRLGLPYNQANNFAFGGATAARDPITGVNNTIVAALPGLEEEIGLFIQNNPIVDPKALYTIWIGANDYLPTQSPNFTPFTTPTDTINSIQNTVDTLLNLGARKIIVVNLPDLGDLPLTRGTPISDPLNILADSHNSQLSMTLNNLNLPPDARIIPLDINSLFDEILANPSKFNLTNVTEPCFVPTSPTTFNICSNPDEYLFWDRVHPTTAVHQLIGKLAFQQLKTPEPGLVLGLITVGILGVCGSLFKTNNKVQ